VLFCRKLKTHESGLTFISKHIALFYSHYIYNITFILSDVNNQIK